MPVFEWAVKGLEPVTPSLPNRAWGSDAFTAIRWYRSSTAFRGDVLNLFETRRNRTLAIVATLSPLSRGAGLACA
jgi:hypothetical protein